MFPKMRPIELSHHLYPGQEEYHLLAETGMVDEFLPDYRGKRPPGQWYIMTKVNMWSHVGTHMEAPFHYQEDGMDIADVPLQQVVGECLLIDFSDKGVAESISLAELQARCQGLGKGDILFVRTGLDHNYRTERSHDRPYFSEEAIRWLAQDVQIACLGVDCSGIEERTQPRQPNHKMLFDHGIPLIEHLAHLDQIPVERFYVAAVPLRLHGVDASPLSVIAFVPEDGAAG
jgi:arylformamidase